MSQIQVSFLEECASKDFRAFFISWNVGFASACGEKASSTIQ